MTASWAMANVPVRDWWGFDTRPEPGAVFRNPGCLGFYPKPIFHLAGGYRIIEEERTRLVYDGFENTMGEAVYADNINFHWYFGSVAAIYRIRNFGFGAGVAPLRDFNYRYHKEYLDDFYVKIGEDRVEQGGELINATASISFSPVRFISLGVGGRYLWGKRGLEQVIIRGPDTMRLFSKGNPSGIGWQAGVGLVSGSKLKLDIGYQSPVRLRDWESGKEKIEPRQTVAGLEFSAPGVLPSRFWAEASFTNWSEVESIYRNIFSIRMGVEHLMLNSVRLNYGFGVKPLFSDPDVHMLYADFGIGFNINRWRLNIGLMASREELDVNHFVLPVEPEDSRVYQTRFNLNMSLGYEF